ncbi:hypothetical protein IMY05_010G0190700 [Salix suchowensis]|nr:hypothetical protein IMY05_010G0190700 [Salix suchowensis]
MVFPAFFVSCVCFEYPIQTCSGHCSVLGSFVSVRFLSYLVWFVLLRSSVMSLHSHALSSLCFHVFALGEGWWSGVCVLQLCFVYKLVSFFIFGVSHCSALYCVSVGSLRCWLLLLICGDERCRAQPG